MLHRGEATRSPMKLAVLFLCLIAVSSLPADSWHAMKVDELSPLGDIIIQQTVNGTGLRKVWLIEKNEEKHRVLLFEHERNADVLFSPDENWIAINDQWGSNGSDVRLFARNGPLAYLPVKGKLVSELAWDFFRRANKIEETGLDHAYAYAVEWSADSQSILIKLEGHGDINHHVDGWMCVFDVEAKQASLSFSLMNRKTVFITQ